MPQRFASCSPLREKRDCSNEQNAIRTEKSTLDRCPSVCAIVAKGRDGCCEWQTDWKACLFVPNATSERNREKVDRHAIDCVSSGLHTSPMPIHHRLMIYIIHLFESILINVFKSSQMKDFYN